MLQKKTSTLLLLLIGISNLYANSLDLKGAGYTIEYLDQNDEKQSLVISRNVAPECRKVNGADPKMVWSDNYANKNISNKCKKTFLTTAGVISPIKISEKIETYGELEVIHFIEEASNDEDMMIIDARLPDWYEKFTLPMAENIPFTYFKPKNGNFEDTLDEIGVTVENGKYSFSEAKTLLLFCNGPWCPQSIFAIEELQAIGYPEEKLKWYRGGTYAWKLLNLTTITP